MFSLRLTVYLSGHGTLNVPADAAILHHYRVCEFGGNDCIKTASTIDTTAFRYKDRLIEAVKGRYNSLKDSCQLYELPSPPRRVFTGLMKLFNGETQR